MTTIKPAPALLNPAGESFPGRCAESPGPSVTTEDGLSALSWLLRKFEPKWVRPYDMRDLNVRAAKRPVMGRKYHSMAHLQIDGEIVCGFDECEFLEDDGAGGFDGPGWAVHRCRDCAEMADDLMEGET